MYREQLKLFKGAMIHLVILPNLHWRSNQRSNCGELFLVMINDWNGANHSVVMEPGQTKLLVYIALGRQLTRVGRSTVCQPCEGLQLPTTVLWLWLVGG